MCDVCADFLHLLVTCKLSSESIYCLESFVSRSAIVFSNFIGRPARYDCKSAWGLNDRQWILCRITLCLTADNNGSAFRCRVFPSLVCGRVKRPFIWLAKWVGNIWKFTCRTARRWHQSAECFDLSGGTPTAKRLPAIIGVGDGCRIWLLAFSGGQTR